MAKSNAAMKLTPLQPAAGKVAMKESQEIDRLIHEKVRLGIISALAASGPLTFSALKTLLDTSDGNVSVHTRKLEEAGYIKTDKGFEGRVPKTVYTITKAGRAALEKYLDHLEAIVGAMRPK